jgi:ABC-type sugar transport system substrate-binding protein
VTKKRIVAMFLTHQDDIQTSWTTDGRAVAERWGIALRDFWAEDMVTQSRQIAQAVWNADVQAVVIMASTQSGPTNLIREAVSRGKPVVLLNRTTSDSDEAAAWSWPTLRKDFPAVLTATVLPDAFQTGRVQALQFKALLPLGGNALYVLGDPSSSDGVGRLRGIEDVLAKDAAYQMTTVVGGFREGTAEAACRRWLRTAMADPGFELGIIGSQSEAMLPGIRRAVQRCAEHFSRPQLLRVPMTAVDGTQRYKQEVDQGLLAATVETPSRVAAAIDLIGRFWLDGAIPRDPIVELPANSYPAFNRLRPAAHPPAAGAPVQKKNAAGG